MSRAFRWDNFEIDAPLKIQTFPGRSFTAEYIG